MAGNGATFCKLLLGSLNPSPYSWRVFDVSVNEEVFYTVLNVSTAGVMVYGANRPLSGQTTIKLTP